MDSTKLLSYLEIKIEVLEKKLAHENIDQQLSEFLEYLIDTLVEVKKLTQEDVFE